MELNDALRGPAPSEAETFRRYVETRDKDSLVRLVRNTGFILWVSVTENLSTEDKGWLSEVMTKNQPHADTNIN